MWGLLCASYRQSCLRTLQGRWLTHTTKPSCERVRMNTVALHGADKQEEKSAASLI